MIGIKYQVNNIYNVDSYKAIQELPDACIDLVVIDPPYDLTTNKGNSTGGSYITKCIRATQKQLTDKDLHVGVTDSFLDELVRVMKKINIYIWCNKRQLKQYFDYFHELNCNFELLVWCKPNPIPAVHNTYLPDIEYCFYFREPGVKLHGSYETKHKFYVRNTNVSDKELFLHPTIKPLDFIKNFIINSSEPGQLVADFFMGSGTTAVAAKELNRQYIGFEIDEEFHRIAVDRVNGITASGQTSIFTNFEEE